jgi:hypothetical protein
MRVARLVCAGVVAGLLAAAVAAADEPCGTYSGRGCAPDSRRVDLGMPSFSDPTSIDNPLFPISRLESVVLVGREEGRPFRSETTLLAGSEAVTWRGRQIPGLISQYMAWRDGRLEEVARDRYAQADDGSVWYFGEDVVDYRRGHVATTEGTWLAGREGPPAMIMPAHPRVGDVFRTENVPGIVFEQVTVRAVDRVVRGPRGPVAGAMIGEELHLDGTTERKTFAPGYGEFLTGGAGGDVEALALAVPTDAVSGPMPGALPRLDSGASGMQSSVEADDWRSARATLRRVRRAWRALRRAGQPPLIAASVERTLARLRVAVRRHRAVRALRLALDLQQSALDLQLRYRPRESVDRDRLELWCQRLRVDARARSAAAVSGDAATLGWLRDRLASDEPALLDTELARLTAAADAGRLHAAADHAARLIGALRAIPRA